MGEQKVEVHFRVFEYFLSDVDTGGKSHLFSQYFEINYMDTSHFYFGTRVTTTDHTYAKIQSEN